MVQEVFGPCSVSSGTEADTPLWARKEDMKGCGKTLKNISSWKNESSHTGMLKDGKWKEKEDSHKEGV